MPVPIAAVPVPAAPAPAAAAGKPVVPAAAVVKPGAAAVKPPAGEAPLAGADAAGEDPVVWEGLVDGKKTQITKSKAERYLSKGAFADKVTQEAKEAIKAAKAAAAKMESDAAGAKDRAKKDTDAWLREHGIDPDEYAKTKLERKVEEGKMTAEQKRAVDLEKENRGLKEAQEQAAQQQKAKERDQLTQGLQQRIENELVAAAKRAGMVTDADTFYAVYESFKEAFELGLLPMDAGGLPPHIADRIVEDAQSRIDATQTKLRETALKLKGPALLEFVGKEAVDAILAARLEQIRSARGIVPPNGHKPPPVTARRPNSYISQAEADAQIKKLRDGA